MIKFFGLIPRRPGLSVEAFHDHWRHPHGTFASRTPTLRGYVQSHRLPSELLGQGQDRYEGVAEAWFDTVQDAQGLADDPHFRRHTAPDEPNFVDMDNLRWLYAGERVVRSGPDVAGDDPAWTMLHGLHRGRPVTTKLLHFAPEGADPTPWEGAASRLGAARHVHCTAHAEVHATSPAAFGSVQELWWPTPSAFAHGAAEGRLGELLDRSPGALTMLVSAERWF